ncbi:hypothetical protein FRC18_001149 [Serendipita sp. 400]|nr:hypothetical protein FRC18_001149 [Serendipita sp. 400]
MLFQDKEHRMSLALGLHRRRDMSHSLGRRKPLHMGFRMRYHNRRVKHHRYNSPKCSRPIHIRSPRTVSSYAPACLCEQLMNLILDSQQLDLNDFPALGAVGSSATSGVGSGTTNLASGVAHTSASYAAQAQHHPSSGQGASQSLGNGVPRDFTNPDDFPALGGQTTAHDVHLQSQGMNGYQVPQQQNHQSISILRNPMLQADDKRQAFGIKQNPQTPSNWNHHPAAANAYTSGTNGLSQTPSFTQQPQQPQQPIQQGTPGQPQQEDAASLAPTSTTNQQQLVQPHTPADQVLHSAADRWGLLALVRALRQRTDDVLSSGQDLGLLGMELDNPGSLYPKFATPWADYPSVEPATEPNYHLPSCYNVAPPPPDAKKAAQFSDETLFFTFYAMPRDTFQDMAAQELYNRGWRYHKTQRLWINMEPGQPDNLRQSGMDGTLCTVWDVEAWERQPRMLRIDLRDLENRDSKTTSGSSISVSNAVERTQQPASGALGQQPASMGIHQHPSTTQAQQFVQPIQSHLRI